MTWTSGAERWSTSTAPVDTLPASDLAAAGFRREYVDVSRPLLIRGAVRRWPAFDRWNDPDHLRELLADSRFVTHREPVPELKWRRQHWPARFSDLRGPDDGEPATFDEFHERAAADEFIFGYALEIGEDTSLAGMKQDVGGFEFLPDPPRSRYYSRHRAFLHGRSYTDWHFHPNDETLMCQFGLPKHVALLPPTQHSWDTLLGVARTELLLGPADPERHPALRSLRPIKLQVAPGDALYIPPHWWHAVECRRSSGRFGVTVAYCWASPYHIRLDPRFPIKRFRRATSKLPKRAKYIATGLAWSALRAGGCPVPQWT